MRYLRYGGDQTWGVLSPQTRLYESSGAGGEPDEQGTGRHASCHGKRRARPQDPPEPIPYVTYILLVLIALIFAWMYHSGKGDIGLVANRFGDKENDLIRAGQYWRFITPIFLHGSIVHLVVNSLSLYIFGIQIERLYGARKYLIIFLVAGMTGNLASFALSNVPSLGASGALSGLVGAGLIFPLRFRSLITEQARSRILSQLLWIIGINFAIGIQMPNVDNWAHGGGLLGGAFVALFLIPNALADSPPRAVANAAVSLTTAALIGLVGWAAVRQWQWATIEPWHFDVPAGWARRSGYWAGPQGAIIQITDNEHTPLLQSQFEVLNRAPQLARKVQPGVYLWRFTLHDGQDKERMSDFALYKLPRRLVAVQLDCTPAAYPAVRNPFENMLRNAKFRLDGP